MNLVVASDALAMPGTLLVERYFVESVLGMGTYGRVLRALDTVTGKVVALKEFARQSGAAGRFLQELGCLFELSHANIMGCESFVMAGRCRYLVCEYMAGGSLRDALSSRALSTSGLVDVLLDVANGVVHAHDHGILHRDLKPENVLLQRQGARLVAKVADFGIAAIAGSMDAQACIGSPAYMAPEQFSDSYDERVDQYALGVMLYEILCGVRPFRGTPAELMSLHLRREPEVHLWVPRLFSRTIRRALAKKPERRFASVRHFRDALLLAVANEGHSLDQEGWPTIEGPELIVSMRGRTYVSARDSLHVLDPRGRPIDVQERADDVVGAEDVVAIRRKTSVVLSSSRGSRTLTGIPEDASLALSSDGTLAFSHRGSLVTIDPRGRTERVAEFVASAPCFVGLEQKLGWFELAQGGSLFRSGNLSIEISGVVEKACSNRGRFEVVARDAQDPGKVHLVRFGQVGVVEAPGTDVSTDGETYYSVSADGSLSSFNCGSGKVARTRLLAPLLAVGAGPENVVCATTEGQLVRFS